jgi:DNA-binding PadR family transcriptional regulator
MSEKEVKDDIIFKELGNLQEKVLFFLAENPENHKQGIQQGINHPTDQYASIKNAVDMLEKSGYLESKKIASQKNIQIKIYHCTQLGAFYALTRNLSADIPKILDAYKNQIEFCKQFRALYDVWGKEHFALFLRDLGEFLPMVRKNGIEQAAPYLLMKFAKQMQSMDSKTKQRNVKEAMKQFPHTKQMLKEMQKNINDLL